MLRGHPAVLADNGYPATLYIAGLAGFCLEMVYRQQGLQRAEGGTETMSMLMVHGYAGNAELTFPSPV